MDVNCGPIITRLAKIANRNFYSFCAAGIGTTVVLAAGRPTFRKARKMGHPRFFSATVKGNPRETYSPEIGATRLSSSREMFVYPLWAKCYCFC